MQLADVLPVDIISVDAAQVYRGMNIGTAKADAKTLAQYPHYLVDICEPEDTYSAADFRRDAIAQIKQSFARNRLPVLVGGTMFYFSALKNGLSGLPAADMEVRTEIQQQADRRGWQALHQDLKTIDPELGGQIRPSDPQRIMRALELFQLSGSKPSELMQRLKATPCPWPTLHFALFDPDRAALHGRIRQRYRQMLDDGLVDEVESLRQRPGLSAQTPSMRTVGYRQMWNYLDGRCSEEEMVEQAVAATRQLAKRQLTWLRNTAGVIWIDANYQQNVTILRYFLKENRISFDV